MSARAPSALYLEHLRRPPRPGGWPRDTPGVVGGEARASGDLRHVRFELLRHPEEPERIADARFRACGCSATLVCASFVSERIVGRSPEDARRLRAAEVMDALGIDPDRLSAVELALGALAAALARW